MSPATVEQRLDQLEKQVGDVLSRLSKPVARQKDWRRTIGMFDDDPLMGEILEGALKARNEERQRAVDGQVEGQAEI